MSAGRILRRYNNNNNKEVIYQGHIEDILLEKEKDSFNFDFAKIKDFIKVEFERIFFLL